MRKPSGLRRAERLGVERCLLREAADESEDFFAHLALAGFGLSASGDRCDRGATCSGLLGGDVIEVVGELSAADVGGADDLGLFEDGACGGEAGVCAKTIAAARSVATETRWRLRIVQP